MTKVAKGEGDPLNDSPRPEGDERPDRTPPRRPLREQSFDPAEVRGRESALPDEGEIDFETDVEYLHRAIYREAFEPAEGRERVPWIIWGIFALSIFWGGLYLGRHGGTFDTGTHLAYSRVQTLVREEVAEQDELIRTDPVRAGAEIYAKNCQACHQPTGSGVAGVFPPLVENERITGSPAIPVLILLHGLMGPIMVGGEAYNGVMPAWETTLSDAEIAAVASFIRQMESNAAEPVDPEVVAALRAATEGRTTPWTEPELDAVLATPEIAAALENAAGAGGEP